MKHLTVTVNGVAYDVTVEETAGSAVAAPAAAPAPDMGGMGGMY